MRARWSQNSRTDSTREVFEVPLFVCNDDQISCQSMGETNKGDYPSSKRSHSCLQPRDYSYRKDCSTCGHDLSHTAVADRRQIRW